MSFVKKGILALTLGAALLAPLAAAQATMNIVSLTGRQYSIGKGMFIGYLVAWSDEAITEASILLPCDASPTGCELKMTQPSFHSGNYSGFVFKATSDLAAGERIYGHIMGNARLPAAPNFAEKYVSCEVLGTGIYCYK